MTTSCQSPTIYWCCQKQNANLIDRMNSTNAKWVPVEVFTWPNTYEYAMSDLLFPYGAAFICASICSAVGLYAFFVNGASYQNLCICGAVSCTKRNLVYELDKIYNAVQGLCLKCVRHKAFGESRAQCGAHLISGAMVYL